MLFCFSFLISCHHISSLTGYDLIQRKYISVTTVMINRWTPEEPGKTERAMHEDPGYSQGALGPGAPRLGNRRQKYCFQRRCRIAIVIGPYMTHTSRIYSICLLPPPLMGRGW